MSPFPTLSSRSGHVFYVFHKRPQTLIDRNYHTCCTSYLKSFSQNLPHLCSKLFVNGSLYPSVQWAFCGREPCLIHPQIDLLSASFHMRACWLLSEKLSSLHHNAAPRAFIKSHLPLLAHCLTWSGAHQLIPTLFSEGWNGKTPSKQWIHILCSLPSE